MENDEKETDSSENINLAISRETVDEQNQGSATPIRGRQDSAAPISRKTIEDMDTAREIENLRKVEAALFISGRWLSVQEMITLTDLNPILIRQLIDKLREDYGEKSAMEILNKDNIWKMDVKPEYVGMINKLATGTAEFTKSEQETLAVIAYKQPVKQSIIVKIRGNKAYEHVKNFISLGLVKAKKLGHTLELALSEEFYDYFHVSGSQDPEHPRNSSGISHMGNSNEISEHHRNSDSHEEFRDVDGKRG